MDKARPEVPPIVGAHNLDIIGNILKPPKSNIDHNPFLLEK